MVAAGIPLRYNKGVPRKTSKKHPRAEAVPGYNEDIGGKLL